MFYSVVTHLDEPHSGCGNTISVQNQAVSEIFLGRKKVHNMVSVGNYFLEHTTWLLMYSVNTMRNVATHRVQKMPSNFPIFLVSLPLSALIYHFHMYLKYAFISFDSHLTFWVNCR